MADYRQIHTSIWDDDWFCQLSSQEKIVFIWLFSNRRASVSGIYKFSTFICGRETGLSQDEVKAAIEVFSESGKVYLEGELIWVKNLRKYNDSKSPNCNKSIALDLGQLTDDSPLKAAYLAYYSPLSAPYQPLPAPCQPLTNPLPTPSRGLLEQEQEQEQEKEKEKEQEKEEEKRCETEISQVKKTAAAPQPAYIQTPYISGSFIEAEKIFQEVTGYVTFPGDNREQAASVINQMLATYGKPETVRRMTTCFQAFRKRYGRSSRIFWLLDWAVVGEPPDERKPLRESGTMTAVEALEIFKRNHAND